MFDSDEKAFLQGDRARSGGRARARRCWSARPATRNGPTRLGSSSSRATASVESTTPGVERWLADLPDGDWDAGTLPSAVHAVAEPRAAHGREPRRAGRGRARSGAHAVGHLGRPARHLARRRRDRGAAAVIVEPAHPARITPLLMSAYGLTEREQEVTRLVLQGDSTAADRRAPRRLPAHGPAAPEEHLREDRRAQPPRPRRQGVLLPLRAAPARQRATRPQEQPVRGGPVPADASR